MKLIITILLLASFTPAIAQKNAPAENGKLITSLFGAINKHDSIAVAGFFADSAALQSPNWEGTQKGRAAVITIYSRYFKGTPDLKYVITNMVSTGAAVVVEYTFSGQFSNPEGSSPAYMKDKIYSLKGCTRFDIAGGKITASVSYFDQVAFLRQMGFFDQH